MAKRRGYQDSVQYAGALLRRVYSGYLCPCNYISAERGGRDDGKCAGRMSLIPKKERIVKQHFTMRPRKQY